MGDSRLTLWPSKRAGTTGRFDPRAHGWAASVGFVLLLAGVAAAYFAFARLGLMLASINPSASPVWPPSGIALASMLLCGRKIWPAIFAGAFLANVTTAGAVGASLAIAAGNTLEAVVTSLLIERFSSGRATFRTPLGVVRFAAFCFVPGPMIAAGVGVGALTLAGLADPGGFWPIWMTWWLGDAAGALIVTPAIALWATAPEHAFHRERLLETAWIVGVAAAIGLLAYSPLIEPTAMRGPLTFLAILPLVLAALRGGTRDTATVALILSGFAVWGTLMDGGPFSRATLNDSFLLLLTFIVGTAVPSLVLAADVAVRRRTENSLRAAHHKLEQHVKKRTNELERAIGALQTEVEERREIDAQLREQRVHLLEAQRLANLGSWTWDVRTNAVTWSQQLFEIYGIRPRDFHGTFEDYLSRVHEDDRDRVRNTIHAAFRNDSGFCVEERVVRPDGAVRHLQSIGEVIRNESGEAVRMLGVCHDITERREAEQALRTSEERYRLLVDSIHDYAIFMLDPSGHVMSWNSGAARIQGYSAREIVGEHFSRFFTEEDRVGGLAERALKRAAETGKFEAEGWRVRKDGNRFWASVVIDPIRDDSGTLIGFAKITRDFTERHQAQADLNEAREKLAQSQKMEALGQLTGGVAHDFNNLLMIVSGHAHLLRNRVSDDKGKRAIEAIATAAGRGQALTHQLLAFSRRQPLSPVTVDIKERIEAVRGMIGSSLRGDIELVCDVPAGIWPARVDVSGLELALVNIAVNARDAMPEGGRVTLTARNIVLRSGDKPAALADLSGEFVEISMTDIGSGIPQDMISKVFEPFFTTKPIGKGTGLGLSQVYGFAHQSGGTVTIESELGRGTRIAIYLPRSHNPVDPPAPTDGAQAAPHGQGTVLVVEDNLEVAEVTSTLLSQLGYTVLHAANATDALERLESGGIDLVFSDVVMPGPLNGLSLARETQVRFPGVAVLLTSGYTDLAREAQVEFSILRKPFQAAALETAVRTALRRRADATATAAQTPA
ncbi:MAG: PAS domain S-box protein [Alphaproteobacteria bacterium]|nr:PAS domain S-box protein [Alphaproteobacteria bacterium]